MDNEKLILEKVNELKKFTINKLEDFGGFAFLESKKIIKDYFKSGGGKKIFKDGKWYIVMDMTKSKYDKLKKKEMKLFARINK